MSQIFLEFLNMSLTASYVIVFVMFIRILLKRSPKIISYALWTVVAFRLIFPFSIESVFSLLPKNTNTLPIPYDIIYQQSPQINSGIEVVDSFVSQSLPAPTIGASVNPLQIYIEIGSYIWILGILALLIYSVISILLLKNSLKNSQWIEKNIYEAKNLKTPFVIGFISPKIYLPLGLNTEEKRYILLHEQTHIKRKDHIIKLIAFLIVSIHWFNPLVWIAFILMSIDMELSCDERVLKLMDKDIKKAYATSLLSFATERHILNGSPLAFGEGNLKARIKNILNYKKASFWIVSVSIFVLIIAGFALATNPKKVDESINTSVEDPVIDKQTELPGILYTTDYDKVKIVFLSEQIGSVSQTEFETDNSKVVAYIDTTLRNSLEPIEEVDIDNNQATEYRIELSNSTGGYSCALYYDTLYDKAYIVKDGGAHRVGIDFARYIDSFLENKHISPDIDDANVLKLFQSNGWTIDYKINTIKSKLEDIDTLSSFSPNPYYFAYNNELSKDIGLDMGVYSNKADLNIEIYRVNESMPEEFYPIQDARAIVVKDGKEIIGAYISAGRHSTFDACSLKGNSFEKVTGKTIYQWLAEKINLNSEEKQLSKLGPEEVIEKYLTALDKKDFKEASYLVSKKLLLENLTSNIPNELLFNSRINLPLTDASMEDKSSVENIKSAKLLEVEKISEPNENTKIFRVNVDINYEKERTINSGVQTWDCYMVYESPQTGWKIESFGH